MRQFLLAVALASSIVGTEASAVLLDLDTSTNVVIDNHGAVHGTGYLGNRGKHGVLFWSPTIRKSAVAEDKYDLREKGWVAPVRNQKQCGSCWAFSITKTLESARLRAGEPALDLSEQEMVSCDSHAYGCNGGMMDDMDYVVRHGLPLESDYPYTSGAGRTGRCVSGKPVAAKGVRWGYCGGQDKEPTYDQIKQCMKDYGVLSVVVAAGGTDWSRGGHMKGCRTRGQNHMVNLIGWDMDELMGRNSWGDTWGDSGDFYARQGCDELASGAQSVSFVVVDGGPAPTPPHVRLPAEIDILPGTDGVPVGVKSEAGVTYKWYADADLLPQTESVIYVTPSQDTVYKIVAQTAAGVAESSVKVHILPAVDFE